MDGDDNGKFRLERIKKNVIVVEKYISNKPSAEVKYVHKKASRL